MRKTLSIASALLLLVTALPGSSTPAGGRPLTLSLDEYTQRAIEHGVQGRENALTFERAGYSREVAFRQTDSPSISADASVNRAGADTSAGEEKTDSRQASVNLTELMPTGTQLNVGGRATGTKVQGLGATSDTTQSNFSASVTQPLYIFVKNSVMRTRRQADLEFANARSSYDATRLFLRSQARNFYYQVMLGEESIHVEQRKADSSKKLLDITQALVQGGKTAPVETMRAKIRFQDDERQLQNAVTNRSKAVLNAKNFIYMPLDNDIEFTTRLEFKPLRPSLERLVQYALLHNPQLRILDRDRELARLDLDTARETTRPTLSLQSSFDTGDTSSVWNRDWAVGGTAHWLFFDSFITRDNVSKAKIGVIIADLNLADGQRTTQLNVNNAFLDIKNAEKQIQDFSASIEQARHNVDVLRVRFRSGLERLIDVFDAENDMRDLDNQYLGLLVSFNQLKDSLSQQLGADVETIQ